MSLWPVLLPETLLLGLIAAVLMADLAGWRRGLPGMALGGLLAVGISLGWMAPATWSSAFVADRLAIFLKMILLAATGLVVLASWDFESIWRRPIGEYLVLMLCALLGMMVLSSASELILLYIGLETATFPAVLLSAYRPADNKSSEGGIKFLILAALASAVLLFGFSLLYASTGTTYLADLAKSLETQGFGLVAMLVMLCTLAGVAFKIALVPFHTWVPDAYEGAPTAVTAFLSLASKSAGFALALRLLVHALPSMLPEWSGVIACLAAASMCLGNFAAIPQTNMKRMLAYSSIAQAGYIAMGLVAMKGAGIAALLFYLAAYLFTNAAAFFVVIAVERATGSAEFTVYHGLAQKSPRLGLALLLSLLSLAGIPPLAGFTAKFYLFATAFQQGYGWLVAVAVINSAVSLYYYLRVIRLAYILPPQTEVLIPKTAWPLAAGLLLAMAGILLLGAWPGPWTEWARAAASLF